MSAPAAQAGQARLTRVPALSIRQPWAWAITAGLKPVENRKWRTHYRGPLLLHAGKSLTRMDIEDVREALSKVPGAPPLPDEAKLRAQMGGIVGVATLVDCVKEHPSPWFFGPYGYVLTDVRPLPLFPCLGKLGMFSPPAAALAHAGFGHG